MTGRTVFHVVPFKLPSSRRGWAVTVEGNDAIIDTCFQKHDAVRLGQERCRRLKKVGDLNSQLIIHSADGEFQKEFTYGADPKETEG